MKKIWSYLCIFFVGFSTGLVAMYKLTGDTINIEVQKIKNKRTTGQGDIIIPVNLKKPKTDAKAKREQHKQSRIVSRNAKRAIKDAKRLENGGA